MTKVIFALLSGCA